MDQSTTTSFSTVSRVAAARDEGPRARSLYAINAELDEILTLLASEGADEELCSLALDAWLEDAMDELTVKADDYCAVIQERLAVAKMRKEEAQVLSKMAASDEMLAEKLKDRLKAFFERVGITKLETLRFKPHVQANGGVLPVLFSDEIMHDARLLPEKFQHVAVTPETAAIREALSAGVEIDGCWLGERGSHIRIR